MGGASQAHHPADLDAAGDRQGRLQGWSNADQADGWISVALGKEPSERQLHTYGTDEPERHHGPSTGSAARCELASEGTRPRSQRQFRAQRAEAVLHAAR